MSGRHRKPRSHAGGRHRRPPGPAHWLAPGLVVVALLGAGGVGAHAALSDSHSGTQSQVPPTTPQSLPPEVRTAPTSTPTPTPTPSATPSAAATHPAQHPTVALRLVITGSVSWIDVRRPNGHVLVSGLVRHGHRLTYTHGPLTVVIGNAGAVQLTRHGTTHKAGRPGEVVRFTVG